MTAEIFNPEWWALPWRSESTCWLVVTSFFVALASALPGVFLVLRRMALAGDAISHSVLPGIVIAFLFTGSLDSPLLVVGAAGAGLLVMLTIEALRRGAGIREDAATGIAFTAFFAGGVLLLRTYAGKVDLDPDCVLFGSLETAVHGATLALGGLEVPRVTLTAMATAFVMGAFLLIAYRPLLLGSFDPAHARTTGFKPGWSNVLLMGAVSIVVVVSFQAVGAVLAVALLILPGATALLCAKRVPGVLMISGAHALLSSVGGLYLAMALNCNVAAAIVLAGAALFCAAWLIGPMDGLIRPRKWRKKAVR
ncbi:metal ABC transporter permease [Luteolibacter ambystomatis]|uniref:Metal ABC transporter permease n=1 Tax=Luteolibacter ambystomatis TaxID=2824561 RepID=A0A975PGL0_9BACT|nr:metal ABC transporter permease [Luteolibacter ambystomatis]QUE52838.1 metal ABC transporter permease [Luteolibacter ambystomatis]